MPKYDYVARDPRGVEERGRTEAQCEADCVRALRGRNLTPVAIVIVAAQKSATTKIENEDLELFCQQVATMIDAGLPLIRALTTLSDSTSSAALKAVCAKVVDDVATGMTLSASLARHPKTFDSYFIAMVTTGETTGELHEAFVRLSEHLQFQREMADKSAAALRYPLTVMVFMIIALAIVNWFVIPAFGKAFAQFGAELPLFTRILIGTSNFMVDYAAWILGAAGGIVYAGRAYIKTFRGALRWARFKLRMPLFGEIASKAALARYCGALAATYASGLPLHQALDLVASTAGNLWMTKQLLLIKPSLEKGNSLRVASTEAKVFTPMALQMIAIGEQTGRLDQQLSKVSRLYHDAVERDLRSLTARIEPILMVFLTALVLVLALGIFLPIWDLSAVAMKSVKG